MPPNGPATPNVQVVKITEVGESFVEALDYFGLTHTVPTAARRGKGALPLVGDIWLLDRRNGDWHLGTCIHTTPTVIDDDVIEGSAQDALLVALAALGFIDDQAERVPDAGGGTAGPWVSWMNVNP
jgi:hypothetical protein